MSHVTCIADLRLPTNCVIMGCPKQKTCGDIVGLGAETSHRETGSGMIAVTVLQPKIR